jgi:hypothetical protein
LKNLLEQKVYKNEEENEAEEEAEEGGDEEEDEEDIHCIYKAQPRIVFVLREVSVEEFYYPYI